MKIQLVQTQLKERRMKNGRDMMVFPLGLLAVGTYVRHHNLQADIEIVDGDFEEDLTDKLDADIVGIQPNILNVDTDLMQALHDRGQTIIVGGVHASQAATELVKHQSIDYVCKGDGEAVMLALSKGINPNDIEGLESKTKQGVFQRTPLRDMPIVDRGLYDQNRYMENSTRFFDKYMPSRPFRRMTNVYSNKGCTWRAKTGGCYFCGRVYGDLDSRLPQQVWQEARQLVEKYGTDFLWDVSDSFTTDMQWLKTMVEERPSDINPYWYVYARVNELKKEGVLDMLSSMNVYQILIGVETGCDRLTKDIVKGNKNSDTLYVARQARERGIKLLPSFVVGLPGESEETLELTYKVAQRIVEENGSEELSVSMLIPLHGAKAFSELRTAYIAHTGQELPLLTDGEEYQRLWFKYKCKTDFDTAVGYMYRLLELTPLKSTFGSPYLNIDRRMPGWNQLNAEARRELFGVK